MNDLAKIGFTTNHKESITPNPGKNFIKLCNFLRKTGLELEPVDLQKNNLSDYHFVIVGSPEKDFTNYELKRLREYVYNGGKLFVILKWGGDVQLKTNMGDLFKGIRPNNDIVISSRQYFKKKWQPILDLEIDSNNLVFKGSVVYDGGCTFEVTDEVEFAGYPSNTSSIIADPRWNGYSYQGIEQDNNSPVLVYKIIGRGSVIYWGCRWSFSDEVFNEYGNSALFRELISFMLGPKAHLINVHHRMQRTQRHRLLHGFPMPEANEFFDNSLSEGLDGLGYSNKPLAIGVIGHPMCNPQIRGCGYCPFPHENYNGFRMGQSVKAVVQELESISSRFPKLLERRVSSIYFGGGTANLTDQDKFSMLCRKLKECLIIDESTEITLEGAPAYFIEKKELFTILRDCYPDSDLRISIGVQTFDDEILRLAGRARMNRPGSVAETVSIANDLDFRISADFLYNLPGRNFDSINNDLTRAIELGLEHICWYHLVVEEGMGTEWSKEKNVIKRLPNQKESLDNWMAVYSALTEHQFEAITVTDFKLKTGKKGNYQYEKDLRNPNKVDWIGLGSYAITILSNNRFSKAVKLMNPNSLDDYIDRQQRYGIPWQSRFIYSPDDLRLFWLTRMVKGTKIPKDEYSRLFETNIVDDFKNELEALTIMGLIEEGITEYKLTPKGFYFADTIAGHLAWMRVNELSSRGFPGRVVKRRIDGSFAEYSYDGKRWENRSVQHFMG